MYACVYVCCARVVLTSLHVANRTWMSMPRTDDLYDLFPLDLPGRADLFPVLLYIYEVYDLAHVAG